MMSDGTAPPPEFSRLVDLAGLDARELVRSIEAAPAERRALAGRRGLIALHALSASVRIRRRSERVVELAGAFEADVEQACVVTLEPVPAHLSRKFHQIYSADVDDLPGEVVVSADEDEDDAPEPLPEHGIDIGEAVVQQLAVALDPYPRKPGAEIPPEHAGSGPEAGRNGAFAGLARLRRS
jgi:hypothetical protein